MKIRIISAFIICCASPTISPGLASAKKSSGSANPIIMINQDGNSNKICISKRAFYGGFETAQELQFFD